jgi:hypothetical protein
MVSSGQVSTAVPTPSSLHDEPSPVTRPRRGDHLGDGTTGFIAALLVLAERPELATPEFLEVLRQAAIEGGMVEVARVVDSSDQGDPPPSEVTSLMQLDNLVFEREEAMDETGMVALPDPRCPPEVSRSTEDA